MISMWLLPNFSFFTNLSLNIKFWPWILTFKFDIKFASYINTEFYPKYREPISTFFG